MKRKKILIAGAGIGGLTAAACLLKEGFDVDVFEQARVLKEVGAGVQLPANAMHIMRHVGLEEAVMRAGVRAKGYEFRLHDTGEVIHQFPLFDEHLQRHGAPFVQIHRADLQALLVAKVRELKRDAVHLNKKATGFAEQADSVELRFADGSTARGDVLLGADGVKSAVSKQIIGGFRTEYTGITAWRILVPSEDIPAELRLDQVTSIFIGGGTHAICYYVRGGSLMNFCGEVQVPEASEEAWTRKSSWSALKKDFEGWHPSIQAIIDSASKDQCYRWSLFSRQPARNWSTHRATLLGDAAHPALPFLAQGAGMAMEDAVIFTRSLLKAADVSEALHMYQYNRMTRTAHATERTEANRATFELRTEGEIRGAYAAANEGKDRNGWLYSYNALTVPLEKPPIFSTEDMLARHQGVGS
ncbi:FAD-dependent monooxygenase [Candidatus Kaiserbacteria bacterium]|nr:FAD-dependent monooxygenase [Candidatus Kaiserbacteria bacterium]